MDIPITEISNMLGVDLLNSQEFSVSGETSSSRGRYEVLDTEECV